MIELERNDDVFVLTMTEGENRWNTTFTRAFAAAIDEVEASDGPAALVTASAHQKFFSNGLDLDWIAAGGEHPGGDRGVFGEEFMALAGRLITLPIPTVAAVNGHAFGAGLMIALCNDVRIMREDRGYLCANELEIGLTIPAPEVALFRHKIPAPAFHETVILAKRWTAPAAVAAGFVEAAVPNDRVLEAAIERAASLAHLAENRAGLGWQKEQLYGQAAALNHPDGAAHMLRNSADYPSAPR
ncbi:MAG: enoyl-CoA hydratase-related protein [Acidimicrobiia bacterium]|nr:enoyl-CoA hydratase-related protein [Acidimicrobiia bacterium]